MGKGLSGARNLPIAWLTYIETISAPLCQPIDPA